jgi:TP901-1 family phage major tail protein
MAKINGTLYLVDIDGVTVGSTTNASITINQDLPETTTKGSGGWREVLAGLRSWEGSFEGLYDPTDTYDVKSLADEIVNRSSFTVVFDSSTAGDVDFTGTAYLSNVEFSAEMESPVSFSASFTGDGTLTVADNT